MSYNKNNKQQQQQQQQSTNIVFLTIDEFKDKVQATKLDIVKNPNSGKLFMADNNGENYKVQNNIDNTLPMRVLVEDGDLSKCCLVNVKSDNTVFSL